MLPIQRFSIAAFVLALLPAILAGATLVGDWSGTLTAGPQKLRLVLHVTEGEDGRLTATLDSPDQRATGLKFDSVTVSESGVRLTMSRPSAEFNGTLSSGGNRLEGVWKQGPGEVPLLFERGPADVDVAAYRKLMGAWVGEIRAGEQSIRLVLRVERDGDAYNAVVDSPDQGQNGIPVSRLLMEDGEVGFLVGVVGGSFLGTLSEDGNTMTGDWRQGSGEVPLELKRTDEVPETRRPQHPTKPYPYRAVEVTFAGGADDVTLAGTLTFPAGEGPFPAVALISGSGAQDRDETVMGHKPFLVLADYLTRRGIAVLRYDDRGTAESTGSLAEATTVDLAADAAAAVRFLRERDDVVPDRMGLIGHSEGALIAPMVANGSELVAFVVLLAPPGVSGDVVSISQVTRLLELNGVPEEARDNMAARRKRLYQALVEAKSPAQLRERFFAQAPGVLVPAGTDEVTMETVFAATTNPWFLHFLAYDPIPSFHRLRVPALALWGALDRQVMVDINVPPVKEALAGGHPASEAVVLPGLNHLFQTCETGDVREYARIEETMSPKALDAILDWVTGLGGNHRE